MPQAPDKISIVLTVYYAKEYINRERIFGAKMTVLTVLGVVRAGTGKAMWGVRGSK